MKKIKYSDIDILTRSAHIIKINKKKDVESLYITLPDEMMLKGWSIDVVDYDYMGFLVLHLSDDTDRKIVNNNDCRKQFIYDLVEIINAI